MRPNIAGAAPREAVTQAIQTIERRVNELGVSEPVVAPYGSAGDQIIVAAAGRHGHRRAPRTSSATTALLELKLVEAGPVSDQATLLSDVQRARCRPTWRSCRAPATRGDPTRSFYLVQQGRRRSPAATCATRKQTIDEYNQPAVSFTLNSEGVAKFSARHRGQRRPAAGDRPRRPRACRRRVIEGAITQPEARITGRFTPQEATDLALVLRSGALPASLTYLEQREVGPTLGAGLDPRRHHGVDHRPRRW